MINIWIRISALSVLLCILVGAYASHGITSQFTMSNLNIYWTAVIYHLFHSIGLLFVALFNNSFKSNFMFTLYVYVFSGDHLFCGSLYLLVLKNISIYGFLTPLGGLAFIAGWIILLVVKFKG
ncbi:MAG: membrane protein [Porticoccaceae bacterium]|nr:MAG: membrane protein [Porticoccaceae bacterium]